MTENGNNGNKRCFCPTISAENIEKLNSAFIGLKACRIEKFRNAFTKIRGFGDIFIVENIVINKIKYWRTVSFIKKEGGGINISFPYLGNGFDPESSIAVFASGNVSNTDIETLVGRISEELIKENQIQRA